MLIRQATCEDAAGIARVQVETWRTTYRGMLPAEYLDSMSCEKREGSWEQWLRGSEGAIHVYVAMNGAGQIIGFAAGGANRGSERDYAGELRAIYILQAYQGQGLGRRLTSALAAELLANGFDSLLLWVFTDNPARRFYESLGGTLIKAGQFELGGARVNEVAYGWSDTRTLLQGQP